MARSSSRHQSELQQKTEAVRSALPLVDLLGPVVLPPLPSPFTHRLPSLSHCAVLHHFRCTGLRQSLASGCRWRSVADEQHDQRHSPPSSLPSPPSHVLPSPLSSLTALAAGLLLPLPVCLALLTPLPRIRSERRLLFLLLHSRSHRYQRGPHRRQCQRQQRWRSPLPYLRCGLRRRPQRQLQLFLSSEPVLLLFQQPHYRALSLRQHHPHRQQLVHLLRQPLPLLLRQLHQRVAGQRQLHPQLVHHLRQRDAVLHLHFPQLHLPPTYSTSCVNYSTPTVVPIVIPTTAEILANASCPVTNPLELALTDGFNASAWCAGGETDGRYTCDYTNLPPGAQCPGGLAQARSRTVCTRPTHPNGGVAPTPHPPLSTPPARPSPSHPTHPMPTAPSRGR